MIKGYQKFSLEVSKTVNLGDFNSVKVSVGIEEEHDCSLLTQHEIEQIKPKLAEKVNQELHTNLTHHINNFFSNIRRRRRL